MAAVQLPYAAATIYLFLDLTYAGSNTSNDFAVSVQSSSGAG